MVPVSKQGCYARGLFILNLIDDTQKVTLLGYLGEVCLILVMFLQLVTECF